MGALEKNLSKSVFFLDYDGTLCPHIEVWEARDYNTTDINHAVHNLSQKSLGAWWNTGRRVESLGSVSEGFLNYPGFFVQGSLYWDSKTKKTNRIGDLLPDDFVQSLIKIMREHEVNYRLEIKPTSARIASVPKTQRKYLKKFVDSLELKVPPHWEWRIGDRGAELLHKEFSKGNAIKYAFEKKLIPEDAIPVVAGDDIFDRPAMEIALERGGYAILVGESIGWITEVPHRSSQVLYFREPNDFLNYLKNL